MRSHTLALVNPENSCVTVWSLNPILLQEERPGEGSAQFPDPENDGAKNRYPIKPHGPRPMALNSNPTLMDQKRYKRRMCAFWEQARDTFKPCNVPCFDNPPD